MLKNKFLRLLSVFLIIIMTVSVFAGCSSKENTGAANESEKLNVICMDVGKGDCILITKGDFAALIDTGYKATADETIALLKENNIEKLDFIIITHYDKDHVGGAAKIISALNVGKVYLPDYTGESKHYESMNQALEETGTVSDIVSEDISFTVNGLNFEIFASDIEYIANENGEGNDNNVSLITGLTYGEDSYLFAGDIEKAGIKSYLKAGHTSYDVVKMPHHGSEYGNTDEFINSVSPEIALITDSADEPADGETLELLAGAGASVYRTSTDGSITVTSDGSGEYTVSVS